MTCVGDGTQSYWRLFPIKGQLFASIIDWFLIIYGVSAKKLIGVAWMRLSWRWYYTWPFWLLPMPTSLSLSRIPHISELSILWQLFRNDSVQMQNAKARLWEDRVEQEPSRQVSHEIVSLGYGDMLKCRQGIILRTSFGRQSSAIRPTIWSQQNHWLVSCYTR